MKKGIVSIILIVSLMSVFFSGCINSNEDTKEKEEIGLITSSVELFALKLNELPDGFEIDTETSELDYMDENYNMTEKYIVDFKNDDDYVIKQQILKFKTKEDAVTHFPKMLTLFVLFYNASIVFDYVNTSGDVSYMLDAMAASITPHEWKQIILFFRLSNVIVSIEIEYKTNDGNSNTILSALNYAGIVEERIISNS